MAPTAATTILSPHAVYHDLRSSFLSRDNTNTTNTNTTTPLDIHRSRLHTIYARPFNHLSIWAYLAFALIILGMFTVVAYLVYTCYHSSRRRDNHNNNININIMGLDSSSDSMNAPSDALGLGRDDSFSHHWEYSTMNAPPMLRSNNVNVRGGMGKGVKIGAGEIGEKCGMGNSRGVIDRNDSVEMKGFGRGHKKIGSESEENIFSLPSKSMSESICNMNDTSFETNNTCNYLSSPPLAHISDKAAAYISFHLPPPPPSPTPAYKEHLERQFRGRRQGPGATQGQHSPVSPSPSCSLSPATASLPPIAPRTAPCLISGDPDNTSGTATSTGANTGMAGGSRTQRSPNTPNDSHSALAPVGHFDSNNTPYVPPLNPFTTPSAVLLFNEPKLSPVLGTLTSHPHPQAHPNNPGNSSGLDPSTTFSRAILSASNRTRSPNHADPHHAHEQKRLGDKGFYASQSGRSEDKENVNDFPISF